MNRIQKALQRLKHNTAEEGQSSIEEKRSASKGEKKSKGVEERESSREKANHPSSVTPNLEKIKHLISNQKSTLSSRLKELGVDVEELVIEDKKDVIEEEREDKGSKKSGSKHKELEGKGKKSGPDMLPQAGGESESRSSKGKSNSMSIDVEDVIESMPESPRDISKGIMSYLNKLQYLALARAEKMLTSSLLFSDPSEMVRLATALKDMQLTIKWTKKMEEVILNNPSKMKMPGSSGSFRLLDRLSMYSKQTKMEQESDGRKSGIKQGNNMMRELDVPTDDVKDVKKVEGA
jgi:hypothetical protein